jgi:hypothetical protein
MLLMSATMQGEVYRQIIDKVILAAQTDFEEGGYTQETLQELKMVSHEDFSITLRPGPFHRCKWRAAFRRGFTHSPYLASRDVKRPSIWWGKKRVQTGQKDGRSRVSA